MIHELKISPEYFDAVDNGTKPFEVRRNDRPFRVGDTLLLREYDESHPRFPYSGREVTKAITYVFNNPVYCPDGYVILGLK